MKKIIGIVRPFDITQTFYVYEDGNKIDIMSIPIEQMENHILNLCEQYEITQVDLTGPKQYIKGIQERVQKAELIKYNNNKININII